MWYQPIECDNTRETPLICDSSNFEEFGFSEEDFKSGNKITNWPEAVVFGATEKRYDGIPDDALQNSYMIPIFSQKFKNVLEGAGIKGIQYLPVTVQGLNGNDFTGFYIENFLNLIEAFDFKNSAFNLFAEDFPNPNVRGKIAGVRKFVLRSTEIGNVDIFRLAEYRRRFFVTQKVKELFIDNELKGYSFIPVDCLP